MSFVVYRSVWYTFLNVNLRKKVIKNQSSMHNCLLLNNNYSFCCVQLIKSALLSKTIYWSAPSVYLGNKVAAYGGAIYYTTLIGSVENVTAPALQPAELILAGANMELAHYASSSLRHGSNRIELVEWHFVHKTTGSSVTRDQLLIVLASLDQLKLRATFFAAQSHPSRLINFSMEVADPSTVRDDDFDKEDTDDADDFGTAALSVERCACPTNYAGSSCERCAPGFYRAKSSAGPSLFACVPCKCNSFAKECDQFTGECIGCTSNTIGSNCESCDAGFFKIETPPTSPSSTSDSDADANALTLPPTFTVVSIYSIIISFEPNNSSFQFEFITI